MIKFILNGGHATTDKSVLSYQDIVELVTGKPYAGQCYSVVYSTPPKGDSRRSGSLWEGKTVEMEDGMVISAMITSNA